MTPPSWGAEAARTLENSLHLIIPFGHVANTPCTARIQAAFLEAGTTAALDTSCVSALQALPFALPEAQRTP